NPTPATTMRSTAARASSVVRALKKRENAASIAGADGCVAANTTPPDSTTASRRARALRCGEERLSKLRSIDRNVQLHVAELEVVAAVEPCERPAVRKLDAADVTVVGVVHLSRHAA